MSADNGIYVLRTKDPEYRVLYASAIDNLYWDPIRNCGSDEFVPIRLVEYFGTTKSTRDANVALKIACQMEKRIRQQRTLEYGICILDVDLTWEEIRRRANN